jgi:hypothetical protein
MVAAKEGAMPTERQLTGRGQSKPESRANQPICTLGLSESDKREVESYVGVGERIADLVCRAGATLRSAAAYVRKSLARRGTDPLA